MWNPAGLCGILPAMNVVLIGMKHCGKSTLGRLLAQRWSCALEDTDDLLVAAYAQCAPRPRSCREIFREEGPELFALLEGCAVARLYLSLRDAREPCVVAAGGRTALHEPAAAVLKKIGKVVYLQGDADELYRRTIPGGLPGFLDPADPAGSFRRIHDQRHRHYAALADVTVPLAGLDVEQAFGALLQALGEDPHAR